MEYAADFSSKDPRIDVITDVFDRSLYFMNKFPRIWLDYLEFLISKQKVVKTRQIFDNSLKSLVITHHEKIWSLYISWAESLPKPKIGVSVYKRYTQINPQKKADFLAFLKKHSLVREQASLLISIINDDSYSDGKTKFEYWIALFELFSTHPSEIRGIDPDKVMSLAITKFTDEIVKF